MSELPLEQWKEWARRDDWHTRFVGSDIRLMIGEIELLRREEKALARSSAGLQRYGAEPLMVAMPRRIQRKRVKGWKMPPNTIVVSRGTKWGNPCVVNPRVRAGSGAAHAPNVPDSEYAVAFYREYLAECTDLVAALPELRGKNLACFCALDQPCHADVLLELANTSS